ncbi:MAG: DUF6081 family protein [Gammaproteobacteria bacterium]
MTATPSLHLYDSFTGPTLDQARWRFLEYPLDDRTWVCREEDAETRVADGALSIRVARFRNAHPWHQNVDNCKHLLLATDTVPVGTTGRTMFCAEIRAENLDGTPYDYRDGFVSFNVLDFATGMVFDVCATSDRVIAIYERLPLPHVTDPFTYIVDAPLSGVTIAPGRWYTCAVMFDPAARTTEWTVDGCRVFAAREVDVPAAVTLGVGFITLHPVRDGRSHSLRGQGLAGGWRNVGVAYAEDVAR